MATIVIRHTHTQVENWIPKIDSLDDGDGDDDENDSHSKGFVHIDFWVIIATSILLDR